MNFFSSIGDIMTIRCHSFLYLDASTDSPYYTLKEYKNV